MPELPPFDVVGDTRTIVVSRVVSTCDDIVRVYPVTITNRYPAPPKKDPKKRVPFYRGLQQFQKGKHGAAH